MKKIYLAGPMSGLPGMNYEAFNREAKRLRELSFEILNPAENSAPSCGTWAGYMRMALSQLLQCQAIALLPGWAQSRGARLEHDIAEALDMLVLESHLMVAELELA